MMPDVKKRVRRGSVSDMAALAASLKAKKPEDWKALYQTLKLNDAQSEILFGVIVHTVADLRDFHALRVDRERYRQLKQRLMRLSVLLANVEYELDRAKNEQQQLDADYKRLDAERQAQATHLRVEKVAADKLQMRPATPAVTQYVGDRAVPGAAASGAAP